MYQRTVKALDMAIILLSLGITVFSAIAVYAGQSGTSQVVIRGENRTWVYSLDAEELVKVRGTLGGDTVVRISGGEVWVESSPCTNQICVGSGHIHAGSWGKLIACIPNQVTVSIEGINEGTEVDYTVW